MARIRRLIWDIETSPNIVFSWRAGYKLNIPHENIIQERAIICICYKWEGEKRVYSLQWDDGCDRDMVAKFLEVASQADELVAHNGDRFDMKWLNTRILKHGLEPPEPWKTVDTLKIAKRHFYFNSNRLDYLGQHLLGHGKIKTDYGMWKAIVLDNCPTAMRKMIKYCKMDVSLLERVWKELEPFHKPATHVGVMNGGDKWQCPRTGGEDVRKVKTRVTSAGTTQHIMQNNETKAKYQISDTAYREWLEHLADTATEK